MKILIIVVHYFHEIKVVEHYNIQERRVFHYTHALQIEIKYFFVKLILASKISNNVDLSKTDLNTYR